MDPELLEGLTTLNGLLDELNFPLRKIRVRACKAALSFDADEIGLADLVECDFDGYSPVELKEWEPVLWDDADYAEVVGPDVQFTAGENVTPQTITALYLTIEDPGEAETVREIFVLPQPILFALPGQTFTRRIRFVGQAQPV